MRGTHRIHAGFALAFLAPFATPQQDVPRADDVAPVVRGTFERTLRVPGVVTSARTTPVVAQVSAPATLLARAPEGVLVERDAVIAELDRTHAEAEALRARFALAEAETALRSARADLERLRASEELRIAEHELEGEELELALLEAEDHLARTRAEVAAGRSVGGQGERAVRFAELALRLAQRRIELGKLRTEALRRELEFERERAHLAIREAEERIDAQRHELDIAQRALERCRVTAPHDGLFVLARPGSDDATAIEVGSLVESSSVLGWILAPDDRQVSVAFRVAVRSGLELGDPAQVHCAALPDRTWVARLAAFDPVVTRDEQGQDVIGAALQVGPDSEALAFGLRVQASVVVERREDVLLVPREAVQTSREGATCVVVDAQGRRAERAIELGGRNDGVYVVERGLEAGERVLLRSRRR